MIKYFILMITALISISIEGCATKSNPAAATVAYQEACTEANKDKKIAVQGFLNVGDKTPCMLMLTPRGIKRSCAFKFMDSVNVVGKEILVYLPEGKENNQAETPTAGDSGIKESKVFARNEIKLHLDDGTVVVPQENIATPVTITGEVGLTGEGSNKICTITSSRVEKR